MHTFHLKNRVHIRNIVMTITTKKYIHFCIPLALRRPLCRVIRESCVKGVPEALASTEKRKAVNHPTSVVIETSSDMKWSVVDEHGLRHDF